MYEVEGLHLDLVQLAGAECVACGLDVVMLCVSVVWLAGIVTHEVAVAVVMLVVVRVITLGVWLLPAQWE